MTYKLLWADDEIELLGAHIIFLQGKGYEVTKVTNGPDAIEACRNEAFDLILLDENMPDRSGDTYHNKGDSPVDTGGNGNEKRRGGYNGAGYRFQNSRLPD